MENARLQWHTWILVEKIHLHSWQTITRNEQMPRRSIRTRLNEQKKDLMDPERPPQSNCPKKLKTQNMMWKILTTQIRKEIYDSLTSCALFLKEQKGCCKWTRSNGELPYIYQHILIESKIQWLKDYIEKCGERLFTATKNNTDNMKNNRMEITRKQKGK